jgi:aerobic carbon-monoxide dehydrogenase small subunit
MLHEGAPSAPQRSTPPGAGPSLTLTVRLNRPFAAVWSALHDPALLAGCVPGARLTAAADGDLNGEMQVALGPVIAVFSGHGRLVFDEAEHVATLSGEAADRRSATRLSGTASVLVAPAEAQATDVTLEIRYALRGPLAQLARGPVVQALAASVAETVARNLEQRLGGEGSAAGARLSAIGLLWRLLRRWLRLP